VSIWQVGKIEEERSLLERRYKEEVTEISISQEVPGWLLVRRCMVGYCSGGAWLAIGQEVPGWLLVRRLPAFC
jgi:hypothetical protein